MDQLKRSVCLRLPLFVLALLSMPALPAAMGQSSQAQDLAEAGTEGQTTITVPPCPPGSEAELTLVPPDPAIEMVPPDSGGQSGPLQDLFFFSPTQSARFTIRNDAEGSGTKCQPNVTGLVVEIRRRGFPVVGIGDDNFVLKPGTQKTIQLSQNIPGFVSFHQLSNRYAEDNSIGALKVEITFRTEGRPNEVLSEESFYIYGLYDSVDDNHRDAMIEFADTSYLPDNERVIRVGINTDGESDIAPTLSLWEPHTSHFGMRDAASVGHELVFSPTEPGQDLEAELRIYPPGTDEGEPVGRVTLRGDGDEQILFIDTAGLSEALAEDVNLPVLNTTERGRTIRGLIDTELKRASLAQALLSRINTLMTLVSSGYEMVDSSFLGTNQDASMFEGVHYDHWSKDGNRRPNQAVDPIAASLASSSGGGYRGFIDNTSHAAVNALLKIRPNINRAEAAFRLTELLNEQPEGVVDVYLERFYERTFTTTQEYANALAKAVVHELGHQIGAVHTGAESGQWVKVTAVSGNTVVVDPAPVLAQHSHFYDEGFTFGVYEEERVGTVSESPAGSSSFVLTQPGADLQGKWLWISGFVGLDGYDVKRIVKDLMSQGFDFGGNKTLDISKPAFKLALGTKWTLDESDEAFEHFAAHSQRPDGAYDHAPNDPNRPQHQVSEDGPVEPFNGPLLWITQGERSLVRRYNFGDLLIDTPGSPDAFEAQFFVRNIGDAPLTVEAAVIDDPDLFTVTGLNEPFTLAPRDSRVFTVAFHPPETGPFETTLRLPSDSLGQTWEIRLQARAVSAFGDIELIVKNNNAGGQEVGDVNAVLPAFGTIRNRGLAPLTVSDILIEQGSNAYTVTGLGEASTLAPDDMIEFDLTIAADDVGLIPGVIAIHSDDPDMPVLRQAIVATGIATESAFAYGRDYVAMEMNDVDTILRAVTDDRGLFEFTLPADTDYHFALFDPVSGLIVHERDSSAPAGQPTQLSAPLYGASRVPDSDQDFLPDDIEFAIGSDPFNIDTDADGLTDFDALLAGLDPLGALADRRSVVPGEAEPIPPGPGPGDDELAKNFVEELIDALEQDANFVTVLTVDEGQGATGNFLYTFTGANPESKAFIDATRAFFEARNEPIQVFALPGTVIINVPDVTLGDGKVNIDLLLTLGSLTVSVR